MELPNARRTKFCFSRRKRFALEILLELAIENVYGVLTHHVIQVLFEKHVSIVQVVIEEVMEMNVVESFDNI